MWLCENCNTEVENSFDTCWNCSTYSEEGERRALEHDKIEEEIQEVDEQIKIEKNAIEDGMKQYKTEIWVITISSLIVSIILGSSILIALDLWYDLSPTIVAFLSIGVALGLVKRKLEKYYMAKVKSKMKK
jgi:hypothetical protein